MKTKRVGRKLILWLFLITGIGAGGYYGNDRIKTSIDQKNIQLLIKDPAHYVEYANVPDEEVIAIFTSDVYPTITLKAGTEEKYGFRHILARHTEQYFINFENKNNATMFSDEITGADLINAIDDFYQHCVDVNVEAYNRKLDRNIVYLGWVTLNGDREKCLMVVNRENESITTFYPYKEISIEEIEEMEQPNEENEYQYEEERNDYYYYD